MSGIIIIAAFAGGVAFTKYEQYLEEKHGIRAKAVQALAESFRNEGAAIAGQGDDRGDDAAMNLVNEYFKCNTGNFNPDYLHSEDYHKVADIVRLQKKQAYPWPLRVLDH